MGQSVWQSKRPNNKKIQVAELCMLQYISDVMVSNPVLVRDIRGGLGLVDIREKLKEHRLR